MTQGEYAKYRGVTSAYISKLKKQGRLKGAFKRKPGTNQVVLMSKVADKLLSENLNQRFVKTKPAVCPSVEKEIEDTITEAGIEIFGTLVEAQTAKETYVVALKKLEYERRSGNVVDVDEVKSDADKAGRLIKEKITSWPGRVAPLIAVETDVFECEQILKHETNQLLDEISDGLLKINTDRNN